LGIDIGGGISATFKPESGANPGAKALLAVETALKQRLLDKRVTDSNLYTDYTHNKLIIQLPYAEFDEDCNPETVVEKLARKAILTFREKNEQDENGNPKGDTLEKIVITGADVIRAKLEVHKQKAWILLTLSEEGDKKFKAAARKLSPRNEQISMWLDDTLVAPIKIDGKLPDGDLCIGEFPNVEETRDLVNMINAGPLPFGLVLEDASEIEPTWGPNTLKIVLTAMLVLLACAAVAMILRYKVPGMVYTLTMLGQIALFLAVLTGFSPELGGLMLTPPIIIGIVISLGIGINSSSVLFKQIEEELANGKTIRGAIDSGIKKRRSGALVGNCLVLAVATVITGCFGPKSSVLGRVFQPGLELLGLTAISASGTVYSIGYILPVGSISNILLGTGVSNLMLKSLARIKTLKDPRFYGSGSKGDAKITSVDTDTDANGNPSS
jgi:protein-export membrane protein SecD